MSYWRPCLTFLILAPAMQPAFGQAANPDAMILTGGFADHVEPGAGGRIDWTNGYIFGEGVGYGRGIDKQQELLAHEAARLVALRNALALAQGVRIDADGTVAGLRDGTVRIRGVVRGHQEVEARWMPDNDPPESRVVMRVPLWGVKSLASVFAATHRTRLTRVTAPRRALVVERVEVAGFVVVVDARGLGLSTSLFPVIRDADGGVLYDLNTLPPEWAVRVPPARFVESTLTFGELRAAVEADAPGRFRLASFQKSGEATTQPTSQPTAPPSRRRAKRRMAVRAAGASGNQRTEVVLTREDVDRIRRSPEGASALKRAQVVIVVDSAAAGTEGRLHPAGDESPGYAFLAKR